MSDKQEDRFFKELLREAGSAEAPEGFSDSVMQRIRAERTVPSKPLVSTGGWLLVATIALGLALWAVLGAGSADDGGWYGELIGWLDRRSVPQWQWPKLPDSLTYGALALMVFMLLHLFWLRRYLFRRLSDAGPYSR